MNQIVIATKNINKVKEIDAIFSLPDLEFKSLLDFPGLPEIVEDGETFIDNAFIKARTAAAHSGLLTIADDSGLSIDYLNGEPGVLSARFGGPGAGDRDKCYLILDKLKGVPFEERTARFVCAAAIVDPSGKEWIIEETCEGIITQNMRGSSGFGYDPIFLIEEYGKTLAELGMEIKNRLSHRAKAFRKVKEQLKKILHLPA